MTDKTITEEDFDEVNREVLNRALQLALPEDEQAHKDQIKSMLAEDGWYYASSFAAYGQQCRALGLTPWESPPCHCDEDNPRERDHNGVRSLKRMLSHGVSRWDPYPVAAIEATRTK
jgi:hypothetical protein